MYLIMKIMLPREPLEVFQRAAFSGMIGLLGMSSPLTYYLDRRLNYTVNMKEFSCHKGPV